jgi:CRP-like cAMP-binding protein
MRDMRRFVDALEAEVAAMKAEGRHDEACRLETLASVPFLDGVPLEALRCLAAEVGESVFPAGSLVVREGDADGVGFFVVVSGVGVRRVGDSDLGTVGTGDHFGAVATIDGGPRTTTVCAVTDLRCLIWTEAAFHELVHDHPCVGWNLLLYLAGLVRASG